MGADSRGGSRHGTVSKDDGLVRLARSIDLSALVWTHIRVDAENISLAEVKRQHEGLSLKFVYTLLDQSTKKYGAIIHSFARLVDPKTSVGG